MNSNSQSIKSLRSLSQIFTTTNLKRIIDKQYSFTDYRIKKHVSTQKQTKREVFTDIYKELLKEYKGEYIYKNALLNKILLGKHSINTTTALSEFKISNSIADFVLLNGCATVYEVKSELDTLDKLDKQVMDYLKFAEKVYVVSTEKLSKRLLEKFKGTNIGVIEYTNNDTLRIKQEAIKSYDSLSFEVLFKTLRKQEYLEIIFNYFGYIPDVPNTKIFRTCLELSKKIELVRFQQLVINKLKERKVLAPELLTSEKTPYEWKHLCYSLNLNKSEYNQFYKYLNRTA